MSSWFYQRSFHLLCLLLFLVFTSCSITSTPGFYHGYKNLSEKEKQAVQFLSDSVSITHLSNNYQIAAIKGHHLRNYAEQIDSLMIYFWSPNCTQSECIPITSFRDYCDKKGYSYLILADYYDIDKMNAQNTGSLPYLIANHIYYNINYANRLNGALFKDFLNLRRIDYNKFYGRFMLFNKGIHVRSYSALPFTKN